MSWYQYGDRRETKAGVQRDIERRRNRGEEFEQLTLTAKGANIASTFWGKAWCRQLQTYQDYESRLPRGRSYLREGNVYNLKIGPGLITGIVAGSALYDVSVRIESLDKSDWEVLKENCAGQVGSMLDLLAGRLGDDVLRTVTDPKSGLFPRSNELRFSCTCPDWADMCKHVSAVLYGVGVKLDTAPDLFFVLRSVDPTELLSGTAQETLGAIDSTDAALVGEDLGALFGIELAPEPSAETQPLESPKPKGRRPRKKKDASP
jgi:uncharacterized Zn finger protein